MTCGCKDPNRTDLWTPIPPLGGASATSFKKPTSILPGENIECYSKRARDEIKDPVEPPPEGKIANTQIVSNCKLEVNEQFTLTPNSPVPATSWTATGLPPGITIDGNGAMGGTVADADANKNYKVMVTAYNGSNVIDSREYNFFPKTCDKEESIKFVWPLVPPGVVTSKFGPRKAPTAGASSNHGGIDIAIPGGKLGDIVSTADGTVVRCGPGSGWGNVIFIEHRDSKGKLVATSVYGHWSEAYVTVGQKVSAGQKIAKEGNVGVGTGAHLHFELHKGKFKNPVDPQGYLNGTIETPDETVVQQDRAMTSQEVDSTRQDDCPQVLPNQAPPTSPSNPEPSVVPPEGGAEGADVQAEIQRALDEDPDLTDADKKHLLFVAKIESSFKADAKNPTSSARGVYQMLDKTANAYYGQIGIPNPTEAQRNDPYLATKAQIAFYKKEQKPYWEEFQNSGGTRIAGKTLSPDVQSRYAGLTQGEFTYGLIHHDGVGNAVKGVDRQGVDYYRKRIRGEG